MNREQLIEWLKAHPLLNISAVAAAIGISPQSLHNVLRGQRPLPKKYVDPLVKALIPYGYICEE